MQQSVMIGNYFNDREMGCGPFLLSGTVDAETIARQSVESLGYEFVDLQISGGRARLVRVFIDHPAGISVDDCAKVSNQLSRVFEVEGVDYERLEISSPGWDRPLRRLADFVRFSGERAHVTLKLPLNGRKRFTGHIASVDEALETLKLRCEGVEFTFRLSEIDKARLAPEM